MKALRFVATAAVAVFAATTVAFAQGSMKASPMPKMAPKMAPKMKPMMSATYVCKMCKMGYTEAQAKTMMMKDPMGHKLVKMAKLPTGYKMAPMSGSKMSPKMAPKPKM